MAMPVLLRISTRTYHQQNRFSQAVGERFRFNVGAGQTQIGHGTGSTFTHFGIRRAGAPESGEGHMKIVAVTACPTGIAHTYMAAEQLEKTAKSLGHQIKVETQGAMGIENELGDNDIRQAQIAIFAVDIEIEKRERFDKVKFIQVPVQDAIKDPLGVFRRIQG